MSKKNDQILKSRPLMYIHQPKFEGIFLDQQVKQVKAISKQEWEKNNIPMAEDTEIQKKQDGNEKNSVREGKTEQSKPLGSENVIEHGVRKNAFVNKTIEEKLLFLTQLPNNMPTVTCEIRTQEKFYQCHILSYLDGLVTVRLSDNHQIVELPRKEIKSLSILRAV
ncbi:hypothetical protein DCC39_04415 [Pueribacillus theae]|uniref:Spore coat protein CotO n=1 Tax=Pueribacillus theae TaxID=2171751 RepID=A0A2U1K599_9BACI|nr:CotO family spore coat protein [Pueribacillus theae]PWA12686.1 hypothetical protein DCC39_04415 [Pueribacillus theae]